MQPTPSPGASLEAELEEAQHRLEAILRDSRDALWSCDANGRIRSWNAEAERLLQYSAPEVVGGSALDLVLPEQRAMARAAWDAVVTTGERFLGETKLLRKDGSSAPVELTLCAVRQRTGNITGTMVICRDISARLAHEQEFLASEARFKQAFQLAPIAMSISTLDEGRYLEVNAALLEATGYTRHEVVGHTARELRVYAHESDFRRVRDVLSSQGSIRELELQLRGKNDTRTVLLSGDIIDFSGRRCLLTASVDITERKAFEAGLAASEARYRAALITGRIAAWETDMVSLTRRWTEEGMSLFGLDLPGGIGQVLGPNDEFKRSLHPDDKHLMEQFHRTADEQDSYPCEYRIVRPDGKVLWVSGRGRVVARGLDGKALRVANMVMDITERKRAEEHAQMLLRELSHRSKNLLAVVQALAAQTGRHAPDPVEFQEKFAQRLQALSAAHDLLVQENWRGAPFKELIKQQLLPFAELGTRLHVAGPPIRLTAPAAQAIGLAIHELATNAIKYGGWSSATGNITLKWTVDGDGAALVEWLERDGPIVAPPSRRGFGHLLFGDILAQSLEGEVEIDYAPAGLHWRLVVPVSNIVLDDPAS